MVGFDQPAQLFDVAHVPRAHFRDEIFATFEIRFVDEFRNAQRRVVRGGRGEHRMLFGQHGGEYVFHARLGEAPRDADAHGLALRQLLLGPRNVARIFGVFVQTV